jgi:hypothetical protein
MADNIVSITKNSSKVLKHQGNPRALSEHAQSCFRRCKSTTNKRLSSLIVKRFVKFTFTE